MNENRIVLGIKQWLIVEKTKTDSPIEWEANLALTPVLGLYKMKNEWKSNSFEHQAMTNCRKNQDR